MWIRNPVKHNRRIVSLLFRGEQNVCFMFYASDPRLFPMFQCCTYQLWQHKSSLVHVTERFRSRITEITSAAPFNRHDELVCSCTLQRAFTTWPLLHLTRSNGRASLELAPINSTSTFYDMDGSAPFVVHFWFT